jgi:hypothetical protein
MAMCQMGGFRLLASNKNIGNHRRFAWVKVRLVTIGTACAVILTVPFIHYSSQTFRGGV